VLAVGAVRGRRLLVALALAALALGACGSSAVPAPPLRTFSVLKASGMPVLCTLGQPIPPMVGVLAGSSADLETVWLEVAGGARVSLTWPAGFTVRFEPGAVIYNENGKAVVKAGETLTLQARIGEHAGTLADPYPVSGAVLGGCYPPS
jgi:hypothetical protein